MLPLTRLTPWYPGQMGVPGSDNSLGLRTAPQGNVYYVDNTHLNATAVADGTDPNNPLTTIALAIAKCTANHHDQIVVGSNHAETITTAAAINCSIAGVRIVGVGTGQNRPRITFTNALATVAINAANVTIENILFLVGIDSVAIMLDVNADDFTLHGCEFRENTAVAMQWLTAIDFAGANATDRAKIIGCKFISEAPGANHAIEIGAVEDGIEIIGNWITGDYAVAAIHSGSILTNLLLAGNYIRNVNAGDWAVELSAAATGMAIGNRFYSDALATCFDPGSLMCADNLATDAIDQSAVPIPATAAGPLPAGSIDADTIAVGAIAADAFAAGAIDAAAIANGAIDAATFAAGAIDAAAIANAAIDVATFTNDALGQAAYGIVVDRVTSALPQTAALNLFTVAGGNVLLKQIIGTVTADIGAVPNATQILHGATALCADLDVTGDITGTRYSITGTFANVMVETAITVPVAGQALEVVLPVGNISIDCNGSDGGGGRVQWTVVYAPLNAGATVTAI